MAGNSITTLFSRENLAIAWSALCKDRVPIAAVVLLCAVIGAGLGRCTTSTTSTAQLLLTPMPLRENLDVAKSEGNPLGRLLARPLDVKTASTLCMSDQVLEKTRDALKKLTHVDLNFEGRLAQLKSALSFEITVAEDTPYTTSFSPILKLTARAATPAEAKAMVDTWAEQCVEAAREFQAASQRPLVTAFARQVEEARQALLEAEQEYEAFRKVNNPLYLQKRIEGYADIMQSLDLARATIVQEASGAKARAERVQQHTGEEQPKVVLEWTPSPELLSALGARNLPSGPSKEDGGPRNDALRLEQVNQASVAIRTDLAKALGEGAGKEAQLAQLDAVIEQYLDDIREMQEALGRAEIEDKRLSRKVTLLETAYREAALNEEYARMAGSMEYPQLQFLSPGAEWRVPRFRKAILFGVSLAFFGFVFSVAVSLAARLFVLPMLRSQTPA